MNADNASLEDGMTTVYITKAMRTRISQYKLDHGLKNVTQVLEALFNVAEKGDMGHDDSGEQD